MLQLDLTKITELDLNLPSDYGAFTDDSEYAKLIRQLPNLRTFTDRSPSMLSQFIQVGLSHLDLPRQHYMRCELLSKLLTTKWTSGKERPNKVVVSVN